MSAIVILNVFFAASAVIGILSLLGWAIVTDRGRREVARTVRRPASSPHRTRRPYSTADLNA
jgi:hypothetical protein